MMYSIIYCYACHSDNFTLSVLSDIIISSNSRYIDHKSFQSLTSLVILVLNDNILMSLEPALFLPLTNLICLDLSGNNLVSISALLAGFDKLKSLKICQVPSGGFQPMPKFSTLVMKECNLESIKPRFIQNLPDLKDLYLNKNDLVLIQNYTFTTLANLTLIDLQSNKIATIHSMAFFGLTALCKIRLNKNKLHSTFPLDAPTLQGLDLDANQVCSPFLICFIFLMSSIAPG